MTSEETKQKIFTRLCQEHNKPGSDGWVKWRNLPKELALPEEEVDEVLRALRGGDNTHDLFIELNRAHDAIRLGASWRPVCEQGQKP
jgi:hypothetical protein